MPSKIFERRLPSSSPNPDLVYCSWLCVVCRCPWWRLPSHPRRLRENYKVGKSGSTSKNAVYQHYSDMCSERGIEPAINATYFGYVTKEIILYLYIYISMAIPQQPPATSQPATRVGD